MIKKKDFLNRKGERMEQAKPYGTVLIKAAKIIDCIAENPHIGLQEIAHQCQMTMPTTLKILDTLNLIGYVKKSEEKTYQLGAKLVRYANQNIEQIDLIEQSLPHLEKLQEKIDETIHLGVLSNSEIYYVNKLEPKFQSIRMSSKVGISRPLYSSAMGKAVLAMMSESEVDSYLETNELKPFTVNTITNPLKLKQELSEIRASGIAFDNEEMEKDIFCIGTALMNKGQIVGAMSISLPKFRVTNSYQEKVIQAILEAKTAIEKELK